MSARAREPVDRVEGIAVTLMRDNVDTDAIMPSAGVRAAGTDVNALARYLFHEWRHDAKMRPDPSFPLHRPQARSARILVAGENFGCGSSREHAVWALKRFGIDAIVAASFGEIFAGNCARNGVVAATVGAQDLVTLATVVDALDGSAAITLDLRTMTIAIPGGTGIAFELDGLAREMLMGGGDEVDITLESIGLIREFQRRHASECPWVYDCAPRAGR